MVLFVIIPALLTALGGLISSTLGALPLVGPLFGTAGLGGGITGAGTGLGTALGAVGTAFGGGTTATALFGGGVPAAVGSGGASGVVLTAGINTLPEVVAAAGQQIAAGAIAPATKGSLLASGFKTAASVASLAGGVATLLQEPPSIDIPGGAATATDATKRRRRLFEERKHHARNIFSGSVYGDEPTLISPALLGPVETAA